MALIAPKKGPRTTTHRVADVDVKDFCSAADVKTRLIEVFRSPDYRPPLLPKVALELQQLVRQPKLEVREAVALLEQEPMLAARLLQLAASALYGGRPVASLETAIVRLGIQRVANLFLQASLESKIFRAAAYGPTMAVLARHCALVAEMATRVNRLPPQPEDPSFMCGLLHDVGTAACLVSLAEVTRGKTPPPLEMVLPAVHEVHTAAGAHLAKMWKLPAEVCRVIEGHHATMRALITSPMVAVVAVADFLIAQEGVSIEATPSPPTDDVLLVARLDRSDLVRLRATAKELVQCT